MKEETKIDMVIRTKNGVHPIIFDKFKGLAPNIALEIIDKKYTTKKKRNEDKLLHELGI